MILITDQSEVRRCTAQEGQLCSGLLLRYCGVNDRGSDSIVDALRHVSMASPTQHACAIAVSTQPSLWPATCNYPIPTRRTLMPQVAHLCWASLCNRRPWLVQVVLPNVMT